MEEVNIVTESFKFMVLGMTTVFLFLLLTIVVLKIQAKLVQKFFPVKTNTATKTNAAAGSAGKKDDAEVIAAMSAAITDFRKK